MVKPRPKSSGRGDEGGGESLTKPARFPVLRRRPALDQARGMHLLYVDESGDTGRHNPQNHTFVLCGLMVHHAD